MRMYFNVSWPYLVRAYRKISCGRPWHGLLGPLLAYRILSQDMLPKSAELLDSMYFNACLVSCAATICTMDNAAVAFGFFLVGSSSLLKAVPFHAAPGLSRVTDAQQ